MPRVNTQPDRRKGNRRSKQRRKPVKKAKKPSCERREKERRADNRRKARRRTGVRLEIKSPVSIKAIPASGRPIRLGRVKIKDLGHGGLFIESTKQVHAGMFTDFSFILPGKRKPVELQGLVRWTLPGKGFGIEFFHATREEKEMLEKAVQRFTPKK